jgi:hypothetical protein
MSYHGAIGWVLILDIEGANGVSWTGFVAAWNVGIPTEICYLLGLARYRILLLDETLVWLHRARAKYGLFGHTLVWPVSTYSLFPVTLLFLIHTVQFLPRPSSGVPFQVLLFACVQTITLWGVGVKRAVCRVEEN